MTARRPSALKVGNHVFGIAYLDEILEGEAWLYGRTLARQTRIEINGAVAASQVRDTVLHEVLHAALNDTPHGLDSDGEERLIRALTPVLLQILRDNPALIRFLREGVNG